MVKFTWVSGGNGITPLRTPRPLLGPIDFANEKSFLVLCLVILAIAGLLLVWVRGGTTGRFLDALRGSEVAAAAVGINPTRWRITAFALSAGLAGVGGGLLAMREQSASYNTFFVAQFGLLWVVIVVSLGARTVEAIRPLPASSSSSGRARGLIPWIFNRARGPGRSSSRRHRCRTNFGIFADRGLVEVSFSSITRGRTRLDDRPALRAPTVFFGIGAITHAKHPEGVLEHNKRKSLARTQGGSTAERRRNGTTSANAARCPGVAGRRSERLRPCSTRRT
jgi:hypothetical protein